jgi:GxxExxY protein
MALIYPDESYAIRGACMDVYKELGNGFLEAVYQECLEMEFRRRGIPFVAQKLLHLTYLGEPLKQMYRPDFVCYDKIIVELKAVSNLIEEHQAQGTNYLKATGFQLCFLVNFGHYPLIQIVRLANTKGK